MAPSSPSPSPTPTPSPPDSQPRPPTAPRRRPSSQYSRRSVVSSFRSPPSLSPSTSLASPALTLHTTSSPALHRQASGSSSSDASTSAAEMKRTLETDAARLQLVLDRKELDKRASKGRGDVVVGVPTEFGGEGGGEAGIFLGKRRKATTPRRSSLASKDAGRAREGSALPPAEPPTTLDPLTLAPLGAMPPPPSWFGTWTRTVSVETSQGEPVVEARDNIVAAEPITSNPASCAATTPASPSSTIPPALASPVDQTTLPAEAISGSAALALPRPQTLTQQALAWVPRPVISTIAALPLVRSYTAAAVPTTSTEGSNLDKSNSASTTVPTVLESASAPVVETCAAIHEGHLPAAPGRSSWIWSNPTATPAPISPENEIEGSVTVQKFTSSTNAPAVAAAQASVSQDAVAPLCVTAKPSWLSLLPGPRLIAIEPSSTAENTEPLKSVDLDQMTPSEASPVVPETGSTPNATASGSVTNASGGSWWGYIPFVGGSSLSLTQGPIDSEPPSDTLVEEVIEPSPVAALIDPAPAEELPRTTPYLRPLAWFYGPSPAADAARGSQPIAEPDADSVSGPNQVQAVPIVAPAAPHGRRPTSSGSSPAPSPRSYGSWLASVAGPTSQQRPFATAVKAIGLGADVGEVMDIDDEMNDKRAASVRQSPPSSVKTQKSSFFSAISKSPSASSLVGQLPAKVSPLSKAGSSRSGVAAIAPAPPNLVLPSFDDIFNRPPRSVPPPLPRRSGLAKKALGALGLVHDKQQRALTPAQERVQLGRERGRLLPKTLAVGTGRTRRTVRRVVIIGVHGWFPTGITRRIAGEPTGTSIAFASRMRAALDRYVHDAGIEAPESVTVMPLEGDGTVLSRVEKLFQDLVGREDVDRLREADSVLIGTHSQGCPVSTHLLARLLAEGYIRPTETTIAMLGLCGVHQGPLTYINKSAVLGPVIQYFDGNAAATELFEFQDTESKTSREYIEALGSILDHNVKVVLVASLNDQVVPCYSAIFAAAHHPNILRLLHIDGWAYDQADSIFVTHLIRFCLQLRNAGVDDGGLIAHLSESVAHGLTGVGHSTAYAEDASYAFAVRTLFESGDTSAPTGSLVVDEFLASEHKNSYDVPWILRGIMDDQLVLELFGPELAELRSSFDQWAPYSQKMKDLRRKLEPLRPKQSRRVAAISPLAGNGPGVLPTSESAESVDESRRSRL